MMAFCSAALNLLCFAYVQLEMQHAAQQIPLRNIFVKLQFVFLLCLMAAKPFVSVSEAGTFSSVHTLFYSQQGKK